MDPQLELFRRQYLQLFESDLLAWPPKPLLKDAGVQAWLYSSLFDSSKNDRLPTRRYQYQVLKKLMYKIEKSIDDPEEDEISDDLMVHLSSLLAAGLPSEATAVQQKTYVTFTCLAPDSTADESPEPTVTLLERRNLISGSLTTGFRTWEAALHLATYLLTRQGRDLIRNKNILELGAGTGLLSILCAKHLQASHVTSTDGDEGVMEALVENLFLNDLEGTHQTLTSVLRWGQSLRGSWVEDDCEAHPYDVVIGADITYDKIAISALVSTLRMLLEMRPNLDIIIAGAVRNVETFETFRHACTRAKFVVKEIDFEPKSIRQQRALFYATAVPLKILHIVGPERV